MILLPDDQWVIKPTAQTGRGIFATKKIGQGVVVGDYIGTVIKIAESNTSEADIGMYLMYYHDNAAIYPADLAAPGMHLINHSCRPNCWMYVYRGHTLFFSLREIEPGEELTVSYLIAPNEACNPCRHQCRCGLKNCTGTMHLSNEKYKLWSEFANTQGKETKRERIRYGNLLKKLDSYPRIIPYHPIYDQMTNG